MQNFKMAACSIFNLRKVCVCLRELHRQTFSFDICWQGLVSSLWHCVKAFLERLRNPAEIFWETQHFLLVVHGYYSLNFYARKYFSHDLLCAFWHKKFKRSISLCAIVELWPCRFFIINNVLAPLPVTSLCLICISGSCLWKTHPPTAKSQ